MKRQGLGDDEPHLSDITIPDLIDEFIRSKSGRVKERTITRYLIHARHFKSFMADNFRTVTSVRLVSRAYIEAHLAALMDSGQQPKTLNAQLRFIQSLFIYAVSQGYCRTNPASGIGRYTEPRKSEKVKFWSKSEIADILNTVMPHYREIYEFMYYTGVRKEEIMYLTWDDVNLDRKEPSIAIQAKEFVPGKHWTPKSKQRRIIPLNTRAAEIIRSQTRSESNNWVFHGPQGGQLHPDRLLTTLKGALRKLGYTGTVHKLRHSFASHLVMSGVGIETVSRLLGHSSIEMTMKYAHLAPDHLRKAVDVLLN